MIMNFNMFFVENENKNIESTGYVHDALRTGFRKCVGHSFKTHINRSELFNAGADSSERRIHWATVQYCRYR